MVLKLNDVTEFPVTAMAVGDFVPGTDISNTTNDANGETVSFSGQGIIDLVEVSSDLLISDPTGVTGADQVTNIMSLTQAEYDAIGTPDASTFYVITGP